MLIKKRRMRNLAINAYPSKKSRVDQEWTVIIFSRRPRGLLSPEIPVLSGLVPVIGNVNFEELVE